ncbi:hypothetical protein [Streptomyces sp. NPDC051569]|uniref:hypothetical protein n=1 Tax=Streptomyces sp. NPDC051569 TaxID=3365661 RepID=UPI0037AD7913
MTSSKARRFLSRLTEEFGTNGILAVQKSDPRVEGADIEDLVPGAALRWPKCECGHSLCPDYEPESPADALSRRLAERNRRSGRGGL